MENNVFLMALGKTPEQIQEQIAEFQGFMDSLKSDVNKVIALKAILNSDTATVWKRKLALYSTFQQIVPGVIKYGFSGNRTNDFSCGIYWVKEWGSLSGPLAEMRDNLISFVLNSDEFKLTDDLRSQGKTDDEQGERGNTLRFCDLLMRYEVERSGNLEQQIKRFKELFELRPENLYFRWLTTFPLSNLSELDLHVVLYMLTDENADQMHLSLSRWGSLDNLTDKVKLNDLWLELCVRAAMRRTVVEKKSEGFDIFPLSSHLMKVCMELSKRGLINTRRDLLDLYVQNISAEKVRFIVEFNTASDYEITNRWFVNEIMGKLQQLGKHEHVQAIQERMESFGKANRDYATRQKEIALAVRKQIEAFLV